MRTGVTVSATAHLAVILVAIIGLSSAQQLTPDAEQSIAVDLVPIADTASVTAGSEQSKVIDKTPAVVETNKPAVPAQPTGNTDQDQPKPAKADTPTPLPVTSSAPVPQPQPVPVKPAPVPQPAPPPPKPASAPKPQPKETSAPTPLPQLAADASTSDDSAPPTPTPAEQAASLAAKRAELKKQQDAAVKAAQAAIAKTIADADAKAQADADKAAAAAQAKATAAAKAAAAAKQVAMAQQAAKAAKAADEISSLINEEKSTGAKTGKGGSPTAGKTTGTAAKLSQSEIGALIGQIKKCWTLLPNEIEAGLSVELLFNLDSNGGVDGIPKVIKADQSEMGGSIARAAQRAIAQCGPYNLPAAKYAEWKQVDVTMFTSDQ